jgi:hypothetical protein
MHTHLSFTKRNSTWTSGGVTYRRTIAPNISGNDGLSKEIKKLRRRIARTRVLAGCVIVFGREKEQGTKR